MGDCWITAYYLALARLLLAIMANLAGLLLTLRVSTASLAGSAGSSMAQLITLEIGLYLLDMVWLLPVWVPARGEGSGGQARLFWGCFRSLARQPVG